MNIFSGIIISNMLGFVRTILMVGFAGAVSVTFASQAMGARFTSTSYVIDASVMNNFGGQGSSANYTITSSGGESIVGNGAGGSYIIGQGYVSQLEKGLQLSVQPKGLEAYYPLNESTGNTFYDYSSNNYNANIVTNGLPTSGQVGNAYERTTTNPAKVSIPASEIQPTSLTVEAWIYPTSSSGCIVCYERGFGAAAGGPFLLELSSGVLRWFVRAGANGSVSAPIANNQWYHVAGSYNESDGALKLYVNGENVATTNLTPDPIAYELAKVPETISLFDEAGYSFRGKIDEVKIFSRSLSSAEIKAEYQAGQTGNNAGLAFSGDIVAGSSETVEAEVVVQTNAPGYILAVSQNQNLTSSNSTIPAISGSIASPINWTEGSTKGLGFTLVSSNATAIPGKWGSGNAYAAFPGSETTFYTRTGYTGGSKDVVNMRLRLDTEVSQAAGAYQNIMTTTGTMIP